MREKNMIRRMGISFAAFMLCMVSIHVPATQINAASRKKTFSIPTVLISKYSDSDGDKDTIKETREFTENGLYVGRSISGEDGLYGRYKVTKRDRKGRTLQEKLYDDSGLEGTYTYKYWKNGRVKKAVYKPAKGNDGRKWKFNKKGLITYYCEMDGKIAESYTYEYEYNKKGDPTYIGEKWKKKNGSKKFKTLKTLKTTIKNTYIKKGKNKGKLKKQVSVARGSKFNRSSSTVTTTIKNKYNKSGRLILTITTTRRKDSDGDSFKDKEVTSYRYKNVKTPKKYWTINKYAADGTCFNQMGIKE